MDPSSQFSFSTRHGRSGSQSTNNDRQLSESSNPSSSFNHPRPNHQSSVSVGPSRQTFNNRHNSTVCVVIFVRVLSIYLSSSHPNKGIQTPMLSFRNLYLSTLIIILDILLRRQLKDRQIPYRLPRLCIHHPICIGPMDHHLQVVYQ